MPKFYDIITDEYREVTQEDVDRWVNGINALVSQRKLALEQKTKAKMIQVLETSLAGPTVEVRLHQPLDNPTGRVQAPG